MDKQNQIEDDLFALAAMQDSEINTADIPETVGFGQPSRGKYFPLTQRGYDIRAIANWCISRAAAESRAIGTLWLNKIVYFIHEKAILDFGILLSNARLEAWKHGPVFREIYFDEKVEKKATLLKKFNKVTRRMEVACEDFSSSDIILFEKVWNELGHKSGAELRGLSHAPGSPWEKVWAKSAKGNLGLEIDVSTILGHTAWEDGR